MKWKAEADFVVGLRVGRGRRKVGFGFGIGRKKVLETIGIDLGEELLRRFYFSYAKKSTEFTWNWSTLYRNSVFERRERSMKRANIINLLLQIIPSSQHHAPVKPPDHWAFLEEVDAPQWVDLAKEAALMGTQGDDPWFNRWHAHHETSLARIIGVPIANKPSLEVKPCQPRKETTQKKGFVSKVKPSLKGTTVKACLGGMQRNSSSGLKEGRRSRANSNAGLKEGQRSRPNSNAGLKEGRRSGPTSNAGLKESRRSSRPRVALLTTSQTWPRNSKKVHIQSPLQNKVTATGSDSRAVVDVISSNAGTVKRSNGTKLGNLLPSLNMQDGCKSLNAGIARNSGESDQSVNPANSSSHSSDAPTNTLKSPEHSFKLYRLPSPPNEGSTGEISADGLRSSPIDMMSCCNSLPTMSRSSPESLVLTRPSPVVPTTDGKIRTHGTLGAPPELLSANRAEVEVNKPSLEISSFSGHELSNGDGDDTINLEWTQQEPDSPRNVGPVQEVDKIGSLSVNKKSSPTENEDVTMIMSNKLIGAQATHPVLEKLRRSWGSALRVKQRRDAEVALGNTRSDSSCRNSAAVEEQIESAALPTRDHLRPKHSTNLGVKKGDLSHRQPEVGNRASPGGEGVAFSAGQQVKQTRREKHDSVVPVVGRSCSVPVLGKLRKSKSLEIKGPQISEDKALSVSGGKRGLAKIQATHLRSTSDIGSKFKKQYPHPDTGINTNMPLKESKENIDLRVSVTDHTTSTFGLERRRKTTMQTSYFRSNKPASMRQLGQAVEVAPAVRTQAQTVVMDKMGFGCGPTRTGVGQEDVESSWTSTKQTGTKLNDLGVLRGKLTKLKSDKVSPTLSKEVVVSSKGCRSGGQVADEYVALATEERKSRIAPKYEPRLHSVKLIREWESKSGRRYYDLQPRERQKVNQEITATSKVVTTRSNA